MHLVNCIPALVNHTLLPGLSYLLVKFVVYVPKMPLWVESMSSLNLCEPGNFYDAYSTGVMPYKISTLQLR